MGKEKKTDAPDAVLRAELILKVRSKLLTAVEAARILGVSRKTYYKWEKRALSGLVNALDAQPNGRPHITPEEEQNRDLMEEISRLRKENDLLERKMELKNIAHQLELDIIKKSGNKKKQ
jgi:transposase-like protein